jgi:hypothetical protein
VFKQLGLTGALAMTRAMGEIVDGWKGEIRAAVRQNFKSTPGEGPQARPELREVVPGNASSPRRRSARSASTRPAS